MEATVLIWRLESGIIRQTCTSFLGIMSDVMIATHARILEPRYEIIQITDLARANVKSIALEVPIIEKANGNYLYVVETTRRNQVTSSQSLFAQSI